MSINEFKIKNFMKGRENPTIESYYPIAMDIGYSAVKVFAPNKYFIFPSFAIKLKNELETVKKPGALDILYKNSKGEIWAVGELALSLISKNSSESNDEDVFNRKRYDSEVFKIISEVGIGIALLRNRYGSKSTEDKLVLQTGLPPKYLRADERMLKESLSGKREFEIKLGSGPWKRVEYDLDEIFVKKQPLGSLICALTNKNGQTTRLAKDVFNSETLIFDAGFGTLDLFNIKNGNVDGDGETFDNLAMHEIMQRSVKDIYDETGRELTVQELQNHLSEGVINVIKPNFESYSFDISKIIDKNTEEVFEEVIKKIGVKYDYFQDHKYIIFTGGTSEAWKEHFRKRLSKLTTLKILSANENDTELPNEFSNVRGYYMLLLNTLKKKR